MENEAKTSDFQQNIQKILSDDRVKEALHQIFLESEQTIATQIKLAETASPPFNEEKRRELFIKLLNDSGLEDLTIDTEGNTYAYFNKTDNADTPTLFLSAHLDSVFDNETDVTVTFKDGMYYGPGIYDDARGLAVVIALTKTLTQFDIKLESSLIIGATVGEEGPGDLRGAKHFFKKHDSIDAFISIDIDVPNEIIYQATGSLRYIYTFNGMGGHSYSDFGKPSAVHAAARAVTYIADIVTPSDPKTTFNVGVINGGTIPTAIAEKAMIYVDMRSTDPNELKKIELNINACVQTAIDDENNRWAVSSKNDAAITFSAELKGDRPAGKQSISSEPVIVAEEVARALGLNPLLSEPASTDINVPLSLGIPAIAIGGGGKAYNQHSLTEHFDPTDSHLGTQRAFITVLALLGVTGLTQPLLKKRL